MRSFYAAIILMLLVPAPRRAQTQSQTQVLHGMDGGTSGNMESIFIPPIKNAPFTLTLATEWSRPLANGGSFTLANERRIARDANGRIYQERWILVPKGGKVKSEMNVRQVSSPADHTTRNCYTAPKACEVIGFRLSSDAVYRPPTGTTGALPDNRGFYQHEDLGVSNLAGVDVNGYKETTTLNAGVLGNDQPMVTLREFWYSSRLGISLSSKVDDPQSGRQVFTVKELSTAEPDPALFDVPAGYQVFDRTKE